MPRVSEMTADEVRRLYHEHIEAIREQLKVMLKTHRPAGESPLEAADLLSDISYYSETLRPWDEGEDDE